MVVKCGLGFDIPYEELMAMLNDTFGFTQFGKDFRDLLPKLYRVGRSPQNENYCVTEDGRCMAAVGAYTHEIKVCGTTLKCRGIGNVAVAQAARSSGYMKDCMHMALSDMIKDGVAMSTLGGRRQRYQYFSYDKAGTSNTYVINSDNIRHTYGKDRVSPYVLRTVEADDALLTQIMALSACGDFAPVRAGKDFHDITISWNARLWAAVRVDENGEEVLIGYAIVEGGHHVFEIKTIAPDCFMPVIVALHDALNVDDMHISLPPFQADYIAALTPVAEGCQVGCSMSYTVLNYRLVTETFMRLKCTYETLPDGTFSLLIHGYAGDERFRLNVEGGKVSVSDLADDETPDLELTHVEALNVLFGHVSPARAKLPVTQRLWFPLPLWMYRADEV